MKNLENAFQSVYMALEANKKPAYTACFTGPRPKNLHGYERAAYGPILDALAGAIAGMSVLGVDRFISGGAQGIDQLALRAVDRVKKSGRTLVNSLYIPFPGQAAPWKVTGFFSQAEWNECKDLADDWKYVSEENPDPQDRYAASKLLHGRNHAMVGDSDIVIAFLADRSMDWEHASGGTAECVRYAHKKGKPILAIKYDPSAADDKFELEFIPA